MRAVVRTLDFRRVEALPRKPDWNTRGAEIARLGELIRDVYGVPGALDEDGNEVRLWPIQVAALEQIHDNAQRTGCGGFFPISVGGGKAWIAFLAFGILESKRPLLSIPTDLRETTIHDVIPKARQYWMFPSNIKIIGVSELSQNTKAGKAADLLDNYKPDVIVIDEVHTFANEKSGRWKRLKRYCDANPHVIVIVLSGTMSAKSLRDYAHLERLSLGAENAPIPLKSKELDTWCAALDEGVIQPNRYAPGALKFLCRSGENPRQGYRRRLTETPGVVASGDFQLDIKLEMDQVMLDVPDKVTELLRRCMKRWEDPNGDPIMEATKRAELGRQLALGFWYQWIEPAPRDWLEARRAWAAFVRKRLARNRANLDTELDVWNEQARKEIEDKSAAQEWIDWALTKDSYTPKTRAQWVSTFAVDYAAAWLAKDDGIVWVKHIEFGKALSAKTGVPYFGGGKKASLEIVRARGPAIASISAHHQGKNLQHWHRNLVVSPPPNGKRVEQLVGRTHRSGQKAKTVTFDWYAYTAELRAAFTQAKADAVYLEDTLGGQQRLNYATILFDY